MVKWIERTEDLGELARDLRNVERLAMDLEADSLYRYRERICLIQLSSPLGDAIIDPLALENMEPLRAILEDPAVEKVFHGADYDIRLLKGVAGIRPEGLFDTMVAAQVLGIPKLGLSDLLEDRFGVRLEKRYQRADWGKRPLPDAMVRYAIEDTRHLLNLREELARELTEKGRMGWAQEEFAKVMGVEPVLRAAPDASRVHGSNGLDDRGRAVLQALLEWREAEAQRRDIPPFKVLSTGALVELGKAPQESLEMMLKVPGITRKVLRLWGDAILAAVRQGLSAPIVPKPPARSGKPRRRSSRHPRFRQRFLSLKTVRDDRAREMGLDPGVLCPNASLKALAGASRGDVMARLGEALKPWQREALEERFKTVLG